MHIKITSNLFNMSELFLKNNYIGAVFVVSATILFKLFTAMMESVCYVPDSVQAWSKQEKWFNTISSLAHSIISSIGCLACFYFDPQLSMKIQYDYILLAYCVSSFSLGYFIHDFIHVITRRELLSSWEILIHHAVVIFCYGVSVVQMQYINFVIVSLLCEINSIFLHVRQLLNLSDTCHTSNIYRLNSLINILTYIFFRICTLAWMVRWLVLHKGLIPDSLHKIGVGGMSVMTFINIILFTRILGKDYFQRIGSSKNVLKSLKTK